MDYEAKKFLRNLDNETLKLEVYQQGSHDEMRYLNRDLDDEAIILKGGFGLRSQKNFAESR